MKMLMPFYYQEFKCIGEKCPDSCCKGWRITVDEDSWRRYQTLEGDLGEKLRNSIRLEDGSYAFQLQRKGGRCPLLNDKNLCEIVLERGEDLLCTTCATYPRFARLHGDVMEYGLALSCPEVARILCSIKELVDFCFFDDGHEIPVNQEIDYAVYNDLLTARRISIDIAQNRRLKIWERLFVLCMFNQKIQNMLSSGEPLGRSHILCDYDKMEYIEQLILEVERIDFQEDKQFIGRFDLVECFWNNFPDKFEMYKNIFIKHTENKTAEEIIREYKAARKEFSQYHKERSCEYENFIVYWLFRYYMQSVEDKVLYKNIAMMVLAIIVSRFFALYQWLENGKELTIQEQGQIFSRYSRSIEHDQRIQDALYQKLVEAEHDTVGYMLFLCRD